VQVHYSQMAYLLEPNTKVDDSKQTQSVPTPLARFTLKDWRPWAISLGFFWALCLSGIISMFSLRRVGESSFMIEEILTLPIIQDTIFAFLAPFIFIAAVRHPFERRNWRRQSLLYLMGGVGFTVVHVFLRVLSYPAWNPDVKKYQWALINWGAFKFSLYWPALKRLFLWNLVEDIFAIYIPILIVAHAVLYYARYRQREVQAAQLQAQLSDARLLALKSQLQPHFLFNTLHSISSLMLRDVSSADTMIARLSDLLRMSLEEEDQHLTSLKRELDFTQAYLDIEKIRFGERLSVVFDISPQTLDTPVPRFLLQPIVENSIKHGISKRTAGGQILVRATTFRDKLMLTVRDNGSGRDRPSTETDIQFGIGLRATRERLRTLYGDDYDLKLVFQSDGGAEVTILLPLQRKARLTANYGIPEGVVAFGRT
jgi:two-component system LytT family sensor kinase